MDDDKIYIDQPVFGKGNNLYSHMACKDINKLHEFAASIGLKRCWFENKKHLNRPHYDVNQMYYKTAVAIGAVPLSMKDFANKMNELFGPIRNKPVETKNNQTKLF